MSAEGLSDVPLGERVTVRHRLPDGRATDVVGTLAARDEHSVTVRARSGELRVALDTVVVHRVVRPTPWRIASFLRRADVAVLDLDGVIRRFDGDGALARAEGELGLAAGALLELAFGLPEARAMVTGGSRYDEWLAALRVRLLQEAHQEELVDRLVTTWRADRGTPFPGTVALVDELVEAGVPVFVFSNGSDRVPEELEHIGLGRLVPWLLNTFELGVAKPAPEAYAAAHARIEERLGRTVAREGVRFTDDRPDNVQAARAFGWQARVFTHPA